MSFRIPLPVRILVSCSALMWLSVVASLNATENWPQFRGPDGQGHADDAMLPLNWDPGRNVAWRTELPGTGWSSPVIWGDQVWMTTAMDQGHSLRVLCVSKTTGRLLFNTEVFAPAVLSEINVRNSHASPTPVVEAGRVYVHFGIAGTACLATDSAKVLWKTEAFQVHQKDGPVSSPVLYGNLLVLTCDGWDQQFVVALDKQDGRTVWKTPRFGRERGDDRKGYCTPLAVQVNGLDQLVVPGPDWTYGYEPLTGKELWRVGYDGFNVTPCPVTGHGLVYVTTGQASMELLAIRLGGTGDITASHLAWRYSKNVPRTASPILAGNELYTVSDSGDVTCFNALSGAVNWSQRFVGTHYASPIVAGSRMYIFAENGKTDVVAVGRKYQQLASNDLKERTLASPAVSGNALFIRTEKALYRIEEGNGRP